MPPAIPLSKGVLRYPQESFRVNHLHSLNHNGLCHLHARLYLRENILLLHSQNCKFPLLFHKSPSCKALKLLLGCASRLCLSPPLIDLSHETQSTFQHAAPTDPCLLLLHFRLQLLLLLSLVIRVTAASQMAGWTVLSSHLFQQLLQTLPQ